MAVTINGNGTVDGLSNLTSGDLTVDTNTLYVDATNNRVGIGTSSPNQPFQVEKNFNGSTWAYINNSTAGAGAGSGILLGTDTNSAASAIFQNSSLNTDKAANALRIRNLLSAPIVFEVNATERMRIDSSGNVLVGTTSGSSNTISSGLSYALYLNQTTTNNSVMRFDAAYASGTMNFIAFYAATVYRGAIQFNGSSVLYTTASDYRLKENVAPISGGIDRLKQLKPSTWSWVQDGSYGEGFLAHEVQSVVPEAISGTKDAMRTEEYEVTPAVLNDDGNVVTEAVMGTREVPDYQGIDQSKLVPLLTAALQEAITKIEDLETRIQALEGN